MSDKQDYENIIGLLVHSYNNYLAGIIGFSEIALLECQQEEVKERLELGISSGREAVDFGRQLLSSIGRIQVKRQSVDLALLLKKLCDEMSCEFDNQLKQKENLINTEKQWLYYNLTLIVQFCYDFSPDCNVVIKLEKVDHCFVINFKPSQLHLSKEQSEKLFDPFYSSRTLLGKKELGLAVVKGFISQMKGNLQWSDNNGFVIHFPIA